ncbi:hypothetical protein AB0L44_30680 [Nonomuraea wenchangensis]|uniref:hypothetical protein n=1 Tax=Nonomuraea wenchangensis TaxID=568860 RepID=UPI0034159678
MTEVLQVVIGGPAAAMPLSDPYLADVIDLLQTVDNVMWQIRAAEIVRRGLQIGRRDPRGYGQGYPPPPDEPTRRVGRELLHRVRREIEDKPAGLARLTRISMASPLVADLAVTGMSGAGIISATVYLFKHPDQIGAWFPKLQTSWWKGREEALKAKQSFEKLRDAGVEMRQLED